MNNRKVKSAKQKLHRAMFHQAGPKNKTKFLGLACVETPKKSLDDLSDYEVDQIWAEAMHIYKTEGFDPKKADKELEEILQNDPGARLLSEKLNALFSSKPIKHRDAPPVMNH